MFGTVVERIPEAHALMLAAVDFMANPSYEVVIAGEPDAADTQEMLERLRSIYLPGMVVLLKDPNSGALEEIAEFTRYQVMLNGAATAYVCEDFTCNLPTNDPDLMISLLGE